MCMYIERKKKEESIDRFFSFSGIAAKIEEEIKIIAKSKKEE